MCGSEEQLYKSEIEGSILSVCSKCGKFGKVLSPIKVEVPDKKAKKKIKIEEGPDREIIQVIVPDYSEKIRKVRESLGLTQEDFARKMNEKVSIIHQIETGHFEPNLNLARKFEKALKISLIEQHEEKKENMEKVKGDSFTIGDIIKLKKE